MNREAGRAPTDNEDVRRHVARAVNRLCSAWPNAGRDAIVDNALQQLHKVVAKGEGNASLAAPDVWKRAYIAMIEEVRRGRRPAAAPAHTGTDDTPARQESSRGGRALGFAIHECLHTLVPARRAAVVLHLQGHTVRQIATLLGYSSRKAESFVYRALDGVRSCLETKGMRP